MEHQDVRELWEERTDDGKVTCLRCDYCGAETAYRTTGFSAFLGTAWAAGELRSERRDEEAEVREMWARHRERLG